MYKPRRRHARARWLLAWRFCWLRGGLWFASHAGGMQVPVDRIVETFVDCPTERIVEKIVEIPVERVVIKEVLVEVVKEVVVERIVEVTSAHRLSSIASFCCVICCVDTLVPSSVLPFDMRRAGRQVPVDRIVERIVEVEKLVTVEKIVEIPVERIVEKVAPSALPILRLCSTLISAGRARIGGYAGRLRVQVVRQDAVRRWYFAAGGCVRVGSRAGALRR